MNTEYDFSAATETARAKAQQALETARAQTEDAVARGSQYVSERPVVSVFSAFAIGLAVGALVAVATRPAPPRSKLATSLEDSRDRLAELFGTVASNLRGPINKTRSSLSDGAASLSDSVARALESCPASKLRWW
ncbi:MAG TPA: hypothetical protein VIM61_08695 [Chthoniobacterales bacterium]